MKQFIPYRNELYDSVNKIPGLKAIMPKGTLFITILIDVKNFNFKGIFSIIYF
jgi:hypothetical protein